MSSFPGSIFIPGPTLPGVLTQRTAVYGLVTLGQEEFFPGGVIIDGGNARDPLNHGYPYELRAGVLLGKITASGKYGASVLGLTTAAVAAGATTLTVAPAVAQELVRRCGTTGSFKLTGPATPGSAGGTVATQLVAYTAVDPATGAITITAAAAACVSGALVQPTDGSETPLTFVPNGYPLRVVNYDQLNIDVPEARCPIGGVVRSKNLVNWPSDPALMAWVVGALAAPGQSHFVFEHLLRNV
jgi:hypothetical protein